MELARPVVETEACQLPRTYPAFELLVARVVSGGRFSRSGEQVGVQAGEQEGNGQAKGERVGGG